METSGYAALTRPTGSIPLALDTAVRDGRIKPGQNILLEAVGGGFTWGAVLIRW